MRGLFSLRKMNKSFRMLYSARLSLKHRIPSIQKLERQVLAFFSNRCAKRIKILWQFSLKAAHSKFNKAYCQLDSLNEKYL